MTLLRASRTECTRSGLMPSSSQGLIPLSSQGWTRISPRGDLQLGDFLMSGASIVWPRRECLAHEVGALGLRGPLPQLWVPSVACPVWDPSRWCLVARVTQTDPSLEVDGTESLLATLSDASIYALRWPCHGSECPPALLASESRLETLSMWAEKRQMGILSILFVEKSNPNHVINVDKRIKRAPCCFLVCKLLPTSETKFTHTKVNGEIWFLLFWIQ